MNITTTKNSQKRSFFWLSLFLAIVFLLMVGQKANAADATDSSITVYWTSPGDDGDVGTASEYDIRYSTSPIDSVNWASATEATGESSPQIAGSTESFTIQNLNSSTLYYIALMTADEVPNWSDLSNILSFSTLVEDTPPDAIASLSIGSKTSASVTIDWTAPGANGSTGTATTYDIRYSTSMINSGTWNSATQVNGEPSPQIAGSSESVTVIDLDPGTQYYFAIKTADDTPNWSDISNIVSTSTDDEAIAPALIVDLSVGTITGNSIVLSWTAPGDDDNTGTADEYDIRYSTSPINAGNWDGATQVTNETSPQVAGSSETFTVLGLDSDMQYYFAINTADEVPNWSGISNLVTGTTPDVTKPDAILDLSGIDIFDQEWTEVFSYVESNIKHFSA